MRPAVAALVALAALTAISAGLGPASAHAAESPVPGVCDVTIDPSNAAATLPLLSDPTLQVFCVAPGDYRGFEQILVLASGTESSRRFLLYRGPNALLVPWQRSEQALFHSIRLRGSWWVIQGITVQPDRPGAGWFVGIDGGDHNVVEGNLIDGSQLDNQGSNSGIAIAAFHADGASHNVIQGNVVRSGNKSRLPVDYSGIAVAVGDEPGGDNDFNQILDNEIYDWGDGVALTANTEECSYAGRPHGTVIDGNDIYITADKRIDCASGVPDPEGDCSCAENGIDVKPDPGPDPAHWTRITNNRLWGFRPTPQPSTCGGSGANGQAITAGNQCAGHVFVAGNAVLDARIGIKPSGRSWFVAGNLFHDMVRPFLFEFGDTDLEIQFNTVVGVDNAYDDYSNNTDTRCNVVIDSLALNGNGWPRGSGHQTEYNYLYDSPATNFVGATNQTFATAEQSQNAPLCFWRKHRTTPEWICVPYAYTTPASPHAAATASCEPDLGAPFGLGPIEYDSINAVPEPGAGAASGAALLVLLAVGSTQRRARRRRGAASPDRGARELG